MTSIVLHSSFLSHFSLPTCVEQSSKGHVNVTGCTKDLQEPDFDYLKYLCIQRYTSLASSWQLNYIRGKGPSDFCNISSQVQGSDYRRLERYTENWSPLIVLVLKTKHKNLLFFAQNI